MPVSHGSASAPPATSCSSTAGVDESAADAHTAHTGFDARAEPVEYVYLRIVPTEVRAWREANELRGRLLMRDGEWLPVDA